jgi:hypothetical protein
MNKDEINRTITFVVSPSKKKPTDYTGDLNEAMWLLNQIRGDGDIEISLDNPGPGDGYLYVDTWCVDVWHGKKLYSGSGEKLSLAICDVWLNFKDIEK